MSFDATLEKTEEGSLRSRFIADYQKMKEAEDALSPETASIFIDMENAVLTDSVKLLEDGERAVEDETNVVFFINGTEYSVPSEKIRKIVGEERFQIFFSDDDLEENSDDKEFDRDTSAEEHNSQSRKDSANERTGQINNTSYMRPDGMQYPQSISGYPQVPSSMMMNPLAAMMSYMMMPFMGMYGQTSPDQNVMPNEPQTFSDGSPLHQTEVKKSQSVYREDLSDLAKSVSDVQERAKKLEKEKIQAEEHIIFLKKRLKKVQEDFEKQTEQLSASSESLTDMKRQSDKFLEKTQELENEKNSYLKQIEELKKQAEDLREKVESDQKESEAKLNSIVNEYDRKLEAANKRIADAEEKTAKADQRAGQAEAKARDTSESDKKIAELEAKLKEKEIQAEQSRKQTQDSQNSLKNLRKETDKIRTELSNTKKQLSDAESKVSGLKEEDSERTEYYKNLESEIKELRTLAYEDALTDTMSSNAFNRDIKTIDLQNTILARVGVRGMKDINNTYGKASGDNALGVVAKELSEKFGKKSVYRVMGDNFLILTNGTSDRDIKDSLAETENQLSGQSIYIAYGVAVGSMVDSIPALVNAAEESMNSMKQRKNSLDNGSTESKYLDRKSETKEKNHPTSEDADVNVDEVSLDEQIISNYSFDDDDE